MTTMKWSAEQEPIFSEFEKGRSHFCVIARAGTGKTTTVKEGIGRAPESKKVYLAFNKKNVLEAKEKITDPRCQVMSLNGLGHRYVMQNWKGIRPDDQVEYDRIKAVIKSDARLNGLNYPPTALIKDIIAFAKNTKPFAKLQDLIAMAEARGMEPESYQETAGWDIESVCSVAERAMELAKKPDAAGRISFNDQLWLPVVMKWVRPWFELVVVDEAQDMNATQLLLAQRSCKPSGRIVLVGDPRQAIYAFRGADVNGMERLQNELKAKSFPLTTTYRCPKKVVELAKILVPDYQAATTAPEGTISDLLLDKVIDTAKPGDAIISRTNAPLMGVCLALLRQGVRAYIEGRDIGMTLLNIHKKLAPAGDCKAYAIAADEWAAARIGKVTGEPDSDMYKAAIQTIVDQAETLKALAMESNTVSEIETRLNTLFDDSDKNPRPAVVLSTVHKAKGLEWSRVFLVKETFKAVDWSPRVCESNNIGYVAITRAKSELVWLLPNKTNEIFGELRGKAV